MVIDQDASGLSDPDFHNATPERNTHMIAIVNRLTPGAHCQ
jgi:hypothetical protein